MQGKLDDSSMNKKLETFFKIYSCKVMDNIKEIKKNAISVNMSLDSTNFFNDFIHLNLFCCTYE